MNLDIFSVTLRTCSLSFKLISNSTAKNLNDYTLFIYALLMHIGGKIVGTSLFLRQNTMNLVLLLLLIS